MSYGPLTFAEGGACHCLESLPSGGSKLALATTEKTAANSESNGGRVLPRGCLPDPIWFNLTLLAGMFVICSDTDGSR